MASGLPVVGWSVGNLPHLARHGIEGMVVPPGDRVARMLVTELRAVLA